MLENKPGLWASLVRVLVLGAALLAAACGPSQSASPTPTAPPPPATDALDTVDPATLIHFQTVKLSDGTKLTYASVLPQYFDPTKEYPILLAMPPGDQSQTVTEETLKTYWAVEGYKRGWIILSPVAPDGQLFFNGSEAYIPEFLDLTSRMFLPEGNAYHLAGISNGGLSAFRIILNTPERFHSLLVLPGYPPDDDDRQKLAELKEIPVSMFVGELDSGWLQSMQEAKGNLEALGVRVSLQVEPGEGHILQSLTGKRLFDVLDSFR